MKNPVCERTKEARKDAGYTQDQMAEALNVEGWRYKKWESRSPIPHAYMIPFCTIVKRDPTWLLSGKRWPDELHHGPSKGTRKKTA